MSSHTPWQRFEHIGLLGPVRSQAAGVSLGRAAEVLHALGRAVWVADVQENLSLPAGVQAVNRETLIARCGWVLIFGGDGRFIQAARDLAGRPLALSGVNHGRLGFLTDLSADDLDRSLPAIMAGEHRCEHRCLLHCRVWRDDQVIFDSLALNDVAIHKWSVSRMIELETRVNGDLVSRQRCDGQIVSTPTGSTAYALSAGGPVLHPSLDALLVTPVCPHMLSTRPLVVPGGHQICIEVAERGHDNVQLTCDGQLHCTLQDCDRIEISKAEDGITLLHPQAQHYFQTLRDKLGWYEPPRQRKRSLS